MKIPELELDTRSKLLAAAVTVFGKAGFEAASVRQIADLAGVNHGSIKYHYSSKGDLWRAAISYLFNKMEQSVHLNEAKWETMSARERVIDAIRSYVRFNAAHPEFHRMLMFETMSGGERLEWLSDNFTRPFADRAINVVALAQEQGVYPPEISPMNLHYINVAACRTLFLMAPEISRNFGVDVFADEEIERHIDSLVKLLLLPELNETAPAGASDKVRAD